MTGELCDTIIDAYYKRVVAEIQHQRAVDRSTGLALANLIEAGNIMAAELGEQNLAARIWQTALNTWNAL